MPSFRKLRLISIHTVQAADNQPLQIQLRRNAKIQIHVESVVMGDERARRCASGDRMHHRRFDFDEAAAIEVAAHLRDDAGALDENLAHVSIRDQIEIPLAIAKIHVGEPVPFFGKREQ